MNRLDGMSMDIEKNEREKLKSVFPECFVEGKLDIDKLLNMCGEYITNDFEKYKFEWKGKSECFQIAQKRTTGTLRPCKEESINFDTTQNLYIEGDNLEVLKILQRAYYRQVKMIYIDPPYNTGNDFVYKDDFKDPMEHYKEVTQQTTKSNPESMGRFHTNWLNMMYPRLRLAANLLRDDGVIFISIDDHEVHNLRKLCDEVFGEENFIAQIVWERAYSPVNLKKHFSNSHDYIVCYAKAIEDLICNGLPRTDEANDRYSNPDNDPRGPWKSSDFSVGPRVEKNVYEIVTPSGRRVYPPSGRCWRVTKEKYQELLSDNRVWFGDNGDNVPSTKRFLADVKQGITPMTIWKYSEVGHSQDAMKKLKDLFDDKAFFDYPKSVELIKRMLQLYTNQDGNDIILDFFSGSATTAHAVMELNKEDGGNRRYIMVQLPEICDEKSEAYKAGYKNICEIGKERIRRAGAKLLEKDNQMSLGEGQKPLDVGFKVFKLDTSNLKTWDSSHIKKEDMFELYQRLNDMVIRIKADRTDLDVVYEIMLKLGVPLTYSVTPIDVLGKKAYSIGDDCLLLVCLDKEITPEVMKTLVEYAPGKIVMSDECFEDNTAMSNAYYILQDAGIDLKLI